MEQALGSLFSIAALMVAGYFLAKHGFLPEKAVVRLAAAHHELDAAAFNASRFFVIAS